MSCDSECSRSGRSLVPFLFLLLVGFFLLSSYKEILRYIKISMM